MNNFEYQDKRERLEGDELFSIPVKAGKRIYYFDVKSTRNNDYFVTVTESRKRQLRDGSFAIDKHKIHLYKEDFEKFTAGLHEAIAYIKANIPSGDILNELSQALPTEDEFFEGS